MRLWIGFGLKDDSDIDAVLSDSFDPFEREESAWG